MCRTLYFILAVKYKLYDDGTEYDYCYYYVCVSVWVGLTFSLTMSIIHDEYASNFYMI